MKIIIEYWYIWTCAGIAAFFGLSFWIGKTTAEKIEFIKKILYNMVLEAEKQLGSKTGQAKFALVVQMFAEKVPADLRKYINAEKLFELIEAAVAEMKKALEENRALRMKINS